MLCAISLPPAPFSGRGNIFSSVHVCVCGGGFTEAPLCTIRRDMVNKGDYILLKIQDALILNGSHCSAESAFILLRVANKEHTYVWVI